MLRGELLHEQQRRANVHVQVGVDVVGRELSEGAEPAQRVVDDEDVDMAERLPRGFA